MSRLKNRGVCFVLTSIRGHYDGRHKEEANLSKGQKLIITVLDNDEPAKRTVPDLSKYMGKGKSRVGMDAQAYIREMRDNDRI